MSTATYNDVSLPGDAGAAALGPKRVLVVDDHAAVRSGIRALLEDQSDLELVDVLASASDALAVAERTTIDVAVLDYQLDVRDGLWLSRKLKRLAEPPAVVIYSAYTDGILAAAAVVAEVDAIVSKASLGSELCDAIRAAANGGRRLPPLPPWLGETVRRRLDQEEQVIFGMLLAGMEPAEIAPMLDLTLAGLESRLWTMLRALQRP